MTIRRLTTGCALFIALAAGEWALYAAGRGPLAGPRLDAPRSWPAWLVARPPDVAVMALLRLLALALGTYLLVVVCVGGLLRLLRLRRLVGGLDRATPAALRATLDRITGVAAAGAVAVAGVAAGAGPVAAAPVHASVPVHGPPATTYGPPVTLRGLAGPQPAATPTTTTLVERLPVASPPATLPPQRQRLTPREPVDLPDEVVDDLVGPPTTTPAPPDQPPADPPTADVPPSAGDSSPAVAETMPPPEKQRVAPDRDMSRVPASDIATPPEPPDAQAAHTAEGTVREPTTPRAPAPVDGVAAPPGTAPTWKVEPGDHFWSIAERLLADNWGRRPSASEVDPYWRVLVDANRARLADHANPDLLFPGQLLVLPTVPGRPAA